MTYVDQHLFQERDSGRPDFYENLSGLYYDLDLTGFIMTYVDHNLFQERDSG